MALMAHDQIALYLQKLREDTLIHLENVFDMQPGQLEREQHPSVRSMLGWMNRLFDDAGQYNNYLRDHPDARTVDAVGTPAKQHHAITLDPTAIGVQGKL